MSNPRNFPDKKEQADASDPSDVAEDSIEVVEDNPKEPIGLPSDLLLLNHSRSGCYGRCPIYNLKIWADGRALYEGKQFVDYIGTFEAKISKSELGGLVAAFEQAQFFDLPQQFPTNKKFQIVDFPTLKTAINLGQEAYEVINHGTFNPDDPQAKAAFERLRGIEAAIQSVVDRQSWHKVP